MKTIFRIFILLLFTSCLMQAQGQTKRLSLVDCIALALDNNPTLQRSELNLARNNIALKQAKNNRLPSLKADLGHAYNEGRSVNPTTNQFVEESYFSGNQALNLNVPIFNGFQTLHHIRKQANAKEAGLLEFDHAKNELKLDVLTAYILVLTAKDMLEQTKRQLAVTEENVHRTEILHKEGAVSPGDYYDLQGQLYVDKNNLEASVQLLNKNRLQLASLLNLSIDSLGDIEPLALSLEVRTQTGAELFKNALDVLPEFKAYDWRIKEAEEGVKVERAAYFPSLSLGAGLWSRYSSTNPSSYGRQLNNYLSKGVSLGLSIPVFNQFRTRNQVKLAKLNLQEVIWDREIAKNKLREETANTVFDLEALQVNVANLREQEKSYKESFRIAQVHFDVGNSNSVVFLTAKTKLDNAQAQLLIKRYELMLQKYINDYYTGTINL